MREAGLVDHSPGGYALTALREAFLAVATPLHGVAERWAAATKPGTTAAG